MLCNRKARLGRFEEEMVIAVPITQGLAANQQHVFVNEALV